MDYPGVAQLNASLERSQLFYPMKPVAENMLFEATHNDFDLLPFHFSNEVAIHQLIVEVDV